MGRIYYLLGKSASGKDTIMHELLSRNPQLKKYVMYTTRPVRSDEIPGDTYHFIDRLVLKKFEKEGKLIECRIYQTVEGPWYYATIDDGQMDPDQGDILATGTLESFSKIKDYFGAQRVIPLYIELEDGERLQRALRRERLEETPSYREMCRRFLADSEDFSEENIKKAGIKRRFINDDLDKCVGQILEAMK